MPVRVSVIVCTYNRDDLLGDALASLAAQTADRSLYEILVVANNSSDSTQSIAHAFASRCPVCRVIVEPRQGLSNARNRGFREARAPWVAYMDDDARAHANFVERILYVIDHFSFDCFGGVYLPWYKYGKPSWFRDEYATNGRLLGQTGILIRGEISGGVSVFKQSVLEQCGGFPTGLGMSGKKTGYGEETLLQVRMRRLGCVIGFDPHLQIDHVVAPCKLSVWWFVKTSYLRGTLYWDVYDDKATVWKLFKVLLEAGGLSLAHLFAYASRLERQRYYVQNWIIDASRIPATRLGQVSGGIRHLCARRRSIS